ncbi:MAG: TVP38/TMEM64 family protein [Mariniblastus sp.]
MNTPANPHLSSTDASSGQEPSADKKLNKKGNKIWVMVIVIALFAIGIFFARKYLNLEFLSQQETILKSYYAENPITVYLVAFLLYVLVTGLSIPGALVLSLAYAWFFGFTRGLVLISFASTAGATLAFLLSRYLLRDWIQAKFGERLKVINEAFDREGNFYLFLMRLIPAFPFFVVNAVMGLTKIKATTFWWVSQLGMLAGTAVYVYAGSSIPDLVTLKEEGIGAIFTSSQLTQLTIAFVLLGTFPIIAKKLVKKFGPEQIQT